MNEDKFFEVNGEKVLKYNSYYKSYTAAYARSTGLPMISGYVGEYKQYSDTWLSKTRCMLAKKPVKDGEQPIAWYKVKNGYAPLYNRTEDK